MKAPPDAENTEAFSADLTPVPIVMPIANARSKNPLNREVIRVWNPKRRATPKRISATVTIQPTAGVQEAGR
jgi:hypothetical protein